MPESDIYRDLGTHDAEIENLKEEVHRMRKDLSEIKDILSQAKGGWRTMMAIAGFGAAVGSAITWALFKLPAFFR